MLTIYGSRRFSAAVFFTGGTTGTPKAVPHTHAGLLWFADGCLRTIPDGFARGIDHAGTVCFTPFFHVMGFVANFVFNLHVGCRAFLLADDSVKLGPSLMIDACRALTPTVLNTVSVTGSNGPPASLLPLLRRRLLEPVTAGPLGD